MEREVPSERKLNFVKNFNQANPDEMTQEEDVAGVSLELAYYHQYGEEMPQEHLKDFLEPMWLHITNNTKVIYYQEDEEEEGGEEPSSLKTDKSDTISVEEDKKEPAETLTCVIDAMLELCDNIIAENKEEQDDTIVCLFDSVLGAFNSIVQTREEVKRVVARSLAEETPRCTYSTRFFPVLEKIPEKDENDNTMMAEPSRESIKNSRSGRPTGRWATFTRALRGLFACFSPRISDDNG